jgi:RNA polymerase sigma-70 factor (ECF subfamily)
MGPGELERVRARDPEAMTAFFDRYFDLVFSVALRLSGDRGRAEDLTQEVFFKVHRAAHTLDPARDPAPWLVGITTNAFRDRWRSTAGRIDRHSASFDDDPALKETIAARTPGPVDDYVAAERERRLRAAIAALPEGLRTIVSLHDFAGWGHDRIAEALGITHDAARKRYSRALAALRRELEDLA